MNMNSILRILILGLFLGTTGMQGYAQYPIRKYEKEWKKVEDLVKKGLPKSALVEARKIYELSKKEKQDAQTIKALLYITGLQSENRDNNEVFTIAEVEKEISNSREPSSSILRSLLASLYWNYYQQQRWQIYQRTKTDQFIKTDIATWGADDFHRKISELYLQSLKDKKLLQQTKLEPYDAIIVKGNVRHLRPTLYDLLSHRALAYFENDESDISKPAYAFEINQASAFDPAVEFISRKFTNADSLSLKYKALLIYQELIAFHINDPKPDALVDVDIHRLQFVKDKSTHPDKEQLYFNAVSKIANRYNDLPAAAQAWYLLAQYYNEKADSYKPYGDSTHRLDRIKAKEICERVLQQKDSSEGRVNRSLAIHFILMSKKQTCPTSHSVSL